jgi:radical SAM superfamily enzyme YgiQ (UPF0313 family)
MENKKFCLIQIPSEAPVIGMVGAKLLPLSLGIIAGYLRSHDIPLDMVDLSPRISEIYGKGDIDKLARFYEKDSVYDYVINGTNDMYESFAKDILKGVDWDDYDIIGISIGPSLSFLQIFFAMILGAYIKKYFNKTLIFGGFNLTTYVTYQPTYNEFFWYLYSYLGYIIAGPGEESLTKLIQGLRAGRTLKDDGIRLIDGLCYVNENEDLVFNKFSPRKIVMPDFDGLITKDYVNYIKKEAYEETMVALYRYPFAFTNKLTKHQSGDGYEPYLIIPYIFNYNCPYNCSFCTESDPEAPRPVIGTIPQVVDEIKQLKEKYQSPYFYFINNAINLSKRYVRSFCEALLEEHMGIYWSDCARFDNTDRELLELMYRAGCRKLVFGMESGSTDMVRLINKKIDLSYAEQVLEWCCQIGIWAELEVIIGMPGETQEYFEESYQYIKRNLKNISFFTTNYYIPMPGSIMYRYPEKYNISIKKDKDLDEIIKQDKALLAHGENPGNYNNTMRVYSYSEISGRDGNTIFQETEKRIQRIRKLLLGKVMNEMLYYANKGYLGLNDLKDLKDL